MKGKQKKLMLRTIAILITILIVCTFAPFHISNADVENLAEAVFKDAFESFFNAIARFLADIADIIISNLQKFFIGDNKIWSTIYGQYFIRYSPGVIFSGTIPAMDINFINPQPDKEYYSIDSVFLEKFTEEDLSEELNSVEQHLKDNLASGSGSELFNVAFKLKEGTELKELGKIYNYQESIDEVYNFMADSLITSVKFRDITGSLIDLDDGNGLFFPNGCVFDNVRVESAVCLYLDTYGWTAECEGNVKINFYYIFWEIRQGINDTQSLKSGCMCYATLGENYRYIASPFVKEYDREIVVETAYTKVSSAKILQSMVSTWYNLMKTIAVVGLLLVLVYVAIRMIISSSTEDKAKYKKMLGDWVAALCLIYAFHYFMAITLAILEAICSIFQTNEYGMDILMSSIRTEIEYGESLTKQFANITIYLVLVILTCVFTYQYLKRFIYAAFLTMIAPLIALTYPIDKIKDGKAQAYTVWLREYLFTVLIQAVHLIVYNLLAGTAYDLINISKSETYNPIYAIVVISFIIPAEKFIRSMFGLNKAEAANTMGAALGGAAVMNGINKLGKNSPKPPKEAEGEKNTKIRTANEGKDPYSGLKGEKTESGGQQELEAKERIKKGMGNVAKKYILNKKTAKGVLKTTGRIAGAATLGTVGLAAGIATGEPEKALLGAAGGIAAGNRVGGNLVDEGANLINGISGGIRGIGDTYQEGKIGKEEYARLKFDKEFKKSAEYSKLTKKYPGQEENIDKFLSAGITDTNQMGIAMKSIRDGKYTAEDAIGYIKMAQASDCPSEVLYDKEKFKEYLEARGIPGFKAEEIRKGIMDFK